MEGKKVKLWISNPDVSESIRLCSMDASKLSPHRRVSAILIPSNQYKSNSTLLKDKLQNKVGLYFLFGYDEKTEEQLVYVGESSNDLHGRIKHQINQNKKSFCNTVVAIIIDIQDINMSHIRYLESLCIKEAKQSVYELQNAKAEKKDYRLDKEDQEALNRFIPDIKLFLSVFGFPILEKVESQDKFYCSTADNTIRAEAIYTSEGLTVLEKSQAVPQVKSYAKNSRSKRQDLLDSKILKKERGFLVFKKKHTFRSPSTASEVVLGRNTNGWHEWKNAEGQTLDKVYRNPDDNISSEKKDAAPKNISVREEFICENKKKRIRSYGIYTTNSKEIKVLKGSTCSLDIKNSVRQVYIDKRDALIDSGILNRQRSSYKFTKDYTFATTTIAASIILGINASGTRSWKRNGKYLGDIYKKGERK